MTHPTDLPTAARRIVERLRNDVCLLSKLGWQEHVALANEAADEIERLLEVEKAARVVMHRLHACSMIDGPDWGYDKQDHEQLAALSDALAALDQHRQETK